MSEAFLQVSGRPLSFQLSSFRRDDCLSNKSYTDLSDSIYQGRRK
jgi:hypothetical protein